jgi:hypothetical protein
MAKTKTEKAEDTLTSEEKSALDNITEEETAEKKELESFGGFRKLSALQQKNQKLTNQLHEANHLAIALERKIDAYETLKKPLPDIVIRAAKGSGNEATAILVASDWHIDETVTKESVSGVNEFNPAVAEYRAKRFFESGLGLINIERNAIKVKKLILALIGDFMTANIHEDPKFTNSMLPMVALLKVEQLLRSGIDFLRKTGKFDEIVIPCCVGNHSEIRTGGKPTLIIENNYEYVIYNHLAEYYKGTNVRIMIPESMFQYVDIYGRIFRFHHGTTIRYSGGLGGLTIPAMKAVNNFNTAMYADLDIFGHLHTSTLNQSFVANGSLIGYSPFAQSIKARKEPPSQTLMITDPKHPMSVYRPIYL